MKRAQMALCVLLLATGLRFHKIEVWSFAGDELATARETRLLFDGGVADPNDPMAKLPRILPAGYGVQYLSYSLFGDNELGSRALPALLGSLLAPLPLLLLWKPLGSWTAVTTSLLVTLWPEGVFQSQQNRFYMTAGFVAGACQMLAANAVAARHRVTFLAACGLAAAAPLFHPVLAALAPGLLAAVWLGMPSEADRKKRFFLILAGLTILVVGVIVIAYQLPLLRGWNAGAGWGYSVPHAALGAIKRLGLPTALLSAVGVVLMLQSRHPARGFWMVWIGGWAATVVVLPLVLTYHPAYSFPFALAPLVLAGYAVGDTARRLTAQTGRATGAAWVAAFCLLNLPALVSHYADGSRYDHRSAARYVASARKPGETVAALSATNLTYYEPSLGDTVPLDPQRLTLELNEMLRKGRTTWLVLPAGRSGRWIGVQNWLNHYARLERSFRKVRLDYDEFTVDVYKFEATANAGKPAP